METQKREFVQIELTERMKKQIEIMESGEYEQREFAAKLIANYFLNQLACQEKAPWNE